MGEGVWGGRPKVHGEGALGEGVSSLRLGQDPLPSQQAEVPNRSRGLPKYINPISADIVGGGAFEV